MANVRGMFLGWRICPRISWYRLLCAYFSIANNPDPSHPHDSLVSTVHSKGLWKSPSWLQHLCMWGDGEGQDSCGKSSPTVCEAGCWWSRSITGNQQLFLWLLEWSQTWWCRGLNHSWCLILRSAACRSHYCCLRTPPVNGVDFPCFCQGWYRGFCTKFLFCLLSPRPP